MTATRKARARRSRQGAPRARSRTTRRPGLDPGRAPVRRVPPSEYAPGRYRRPAGSGVLRGICSRVVGAAALASGTVFRAHGGTQIPDGARRDRAGWPS
jgi:hypothetical protein